ncbi:MAG: hypothetical protein GXN98_02855 [Euryarchaeota archaeon]|nr:hypothetical protein [Euryarchaeota archaeon]
MEERILAAVLTALLLIPAVHAGEADFYVVGVSPQVLPAGKVSTVNLSIANLGTDYALYVYTVVEVPPDSPVKVVGAAKRYVIKRADEGERTMYFGAILQNQRFSVSYTLSVDEDAEPGAYQLPLKISWINRLGERVEQQTTFGVQIAGTPELVLRSVNISPERLYPDTEFMLTLAVENTGTEDATNTRVELELPEDISGERSSYLGTLKRGEVATATFALRSGGAGERSIGIKLSSDGWQDEEKIKLYVSEKKPPELEIAGLDTSPADLVPGRSFTLSLQLENIGEQDARAVRVELELPGWLSGGSTSYLGTIKEDDTATAIFDLELAQDAPQGEQSIPVRVYYLDETDRQREESMQIALSIGRPAEAKPLFLLPVAVVLLVLILLWRRRRGAEV